MPSSGSQPAGTTTTVQRSDPWEGVRPFLGDIYSEAQRQYRAQPPQYFPHSTVTPFASETEEALGQRADLARQGFAPQQAAAQQLGQTIAGDYLSPETNPFLRETFNQAADVIQPRLSGMFSAGGRYGSGAHQEELGRTLGNLATNIYGGNYQQERGRQLQSTFAAPSFALSRFSDADQLAKVGQEREGLGQAQLSDAIARFNFGQTQPQQKLAQYSGLLQGAPGGETTVAQPYYRNPLGGALGGALGGLAASQYLPEGNSSWLVPLLLGSAGLGAMA